MEVQQSEQQISYAGTPRERRPEVQRREAFRVGMRVAIHIESPMKMFCELVDISVLGARFDRELPCTPGVKIRFLMELPSYGAGTKPDELELAAEVVRVHYGATGVRFVDLNKEQSRAVSDLVGQRQRMILAALKANRQGPSENTRYWFG